MIKNDTFIIAKDGTKCISVAVAVWVLMMIIDADLLSFIAFAAVLATLWAYRNPERVTPYQQEDSIVSVADGIIKSIETLEGEEHFKVSIKTGFLDTSILRAPFDGTVKESVCVAGARLSGNTALSTKLNEQSHVTFINGEKEIEVNHNLQRANVNIVNPLERGDEIKQGGRYGLMVQGESSMILPANSRVSVKVGQRVRAGETLIGFFS